MYTLKLLARRCGLLAGTTSEQAGGERAGKAVRFEQEDADWVKAQSPSSSGDGRDGALEGNYARERLSDTAIRGVYPDYGELRMKFHGRPLDLSEDIEERRRRGFFSVHPAQETFSGTPAIAKPCASTVSSSRSSFHGHEIFRQHILRATMICFIPVTRRATCGTRAMQRNLFEPVAPNLKPTPCSSPRPIANRQHFSPSDKPPSPCSAGRVKPIYEGITLGMKRCFFCWSTHAGYRRRRRDEYHDSSPLKNGPGNRSPTRARREKIPHSLAVLAGGIVMTQAAGVIACSLRGHHFGNRHAAVPRPYEDDSGKVDITSSVVRPMMLHNHPGRRA